MAWFLMGLDYHSANEVVLVLGDLGNCPSGPIKAVGETFFFEDDYVPYLGVSLWVVPFLLVGPNPVKVVFPVSVEFVREGLYPFPVFGSICE